MKRDDNASALDKERQAEELSRQMSESLECRRSCVAWGWGLGDSIVDEAASKIVGYCKRKKLLYWTHNAVTAHSIA